MGRPADWVRERGGNVAIGAAPAAATGAVDPVDDLERIRMRMRKQKEIEELEAEVEADREQRKADREQRRIDGNLTRERQLRALEKLAEGGDSDADSRGNAAMRDIVNNLSSERTELLRLLQDTQSRLFEQMNANQQQQVASLEHRLASMAQPTAADPLRALVDSARALKEVREAVDTALPAPVTPHIDPNLSRHEALERLRIEGEVAVRTLEAQGRLEEARAKRETNRQDYEMRSKRIDGAFGAVNSILGPAVANLAGDKLGGLFGGAAGEEASPALAEAQTFPCPRCSRPVTVAASENSVVCKNCLELLVRPGTNPPAPPVVPPRDAWQES